MNKQIPKFETEPEREEYARKLAEEWVNNLDPTEVEKYGRENLISDRTMELMQELPESEDLKRKTVPEE